RGKSDARALLRDEPPEGGPKRRDATGRDKDRRATRDLANCGDVTPNNRETVCERFDVRDGIALANRRQREDRRGGVAALQGGCPERAVHTNASGKSAFRDRAAHSRRVSGVR